MNNERYLFQIILEDLTLKNKVALFLFFAVLISGFATIMMIHETRMLMIEYHGIEQQIKKLENAYPHLQLQEDVLSKRSSVEKMAESFGLKPISKEQEVFIEEKQWQLHKKN